MIQAGLIKLITDGIAGLTAYGRHVSDNATLPAVTTEIQGGARQRTHGPNGLPVVDQVEKDMQVTVWAESEPQAARLGQQLIDLLESYRGDVEDTGTSPITYHRVGDIQIFDEDQEYDEEYDRFGYILFLTISFSDL